MKWVQLTSRRSNNVTGQEEDMEMEDIRMEETGVGDETGMEEETWV